MWIKYRTKHSHGYNNWVFEKFVSKKEVEPFLQDIADQHNFSEHWRGIDWKEIKLPPLFILKEKLEQANRRIARLREQLEDDRERQYYEKMISEDRRKIKVSCVKCGNHTYCKGVRMKEDGSKVYGNSPLKKNSDECIKAFVLNSKR